MNVIQRYKHNVYTIETNKIASTEDDEKLYIT